MKTDDLIALLSRDALLNERGSREKLTLALLAAVVMAGMVFAVIIRPRADLMTVATTTVFSIKLLFVLTLALAAVGLLRAAAKTEARLPAMLGVIPVAVLLFGFAYDVSTEPVAQLGTRLVGKNAAFCLVAIPFMAIMPMVGLFYALRSSAPNSPTVAGAMAGFASGAIAAAFYALHCTDDSPFFVAVWYSAAILILTAIGAALGRRILAW
ncbi:MAG: DUF1109 domain-containing protein [Alphaproteobacteria bacterium]|jgi:hypothetical protein